MIFLILIGVALITTGTVVGYNSSHHESNATIEVRMANETKSAYVETLSQETLDTYKNSETIDKNTNATQNHDLITDKTTEQKMSLTEIEQSYKKSVWEMDEITAEVMIEGGANVNQPLIVNKQKWLPLEIVSGKRDGIGNKKFVEMLLRKPVTMEHVCKGFTTSVYYDLPEIVTTYVNNWEHLYTCYDAKKEDMVRVAVDRKSTKALRVLLEAGFPPDNPSINDKKTPMQIVESGNDNELFYLMMRYARI